MAPNDLGQSFGRADFYRTITMAVADLTENGFDSAERVQFWIQQIRAAAYASMTPVHVLEEQLAATFRGIYQRQVERGGILKQHPGVARFTLERVKPRLRAELDRRLMASRELIKLNREKSISETVQRFSGWATSVPPGGTDAINKAVVKATIRKSLAQLPFESRRVMIDQGAKMISNLNEIIAVDGGAIAGEWHSHFRQIGYNARIEHKHFDGHIFVVRGNWAIEKGLMKLDGAKYTDEVERPAELPFCRCTYRYLYSLRSLPPSMVTQKGQDELRRVKVAA